MSDLQSDREPEIAEARTKRRRFSWIWLIPIGAACVAAYLGYTTVSGRGPLITVEFSSADGMTAGQTQVRYKSVAVGTVESLKLNGDLTRVITRIRMASDVEDRLTENAHFWVVRPRFTPGNVSGLETIVSGAYIEFDPGVANGNTISDFKGLDDPPGIRSDEPGRIFTITTRRLGALSQGSPVFFRDVPVGEVLGYDQPKIDGDILVRVFVRAPYESYLRKGSRFWNASGVSLNLGAGGVQLELESLRAVLAGGIAFDTPPSLRDTPKAPDDTQYVLYDNADAARSATSADRIEFLVYLNGSVRGLQRGSPVEMRGLRIGNVTDIDLAYAPSADPTEFGSFRVPVRIAIEPSRIAFPTGRPQVEVLAVAKTLVARGLRAQLKSGNLLTGSQVLALDFVDNAPPAEVTEENGTIVLPAVGGDSSDIMGAVSAIAGKLEQFPLDEIGRNLNGALASVNSLVSGPELKEAVAGLSGTLGQVRDLVSKADRGLEPVLRRLPDIANNLDQAVRRANTAIGSIERGYGGDSSVNRQLDRMMQQVTDAARSIRQLTDFLERHPEALIRGRTTP